MARFFSFNAIDACQTTGIHFDALCLTYGNDEDVSSLQFFGDLEVSIKKCKVLPDCLVVMASASLATKLHDYWCADHTQQKTIVNRGTKSECIFIKSYYF